MWKRTSERAAPSPSVETSLSPLRLGRLVGMLFVAGGSIALLALLAPQQMGVDRVWAAILPTASIGVGIIALLAPWDRWPRFALASLVLVALVFQSVGAVSRGIDPFTYSLYLPVLYVWIGLALPRGTSLLSLPLAACAQLLPIIALDLPARDIASAASALPVYMLIGETVAWVTEHLRRSQQATVEEWDRRYRELLAQFSRMALKTDVDGRVTFVNDEIIAATGSRRDEIIGRHWTEVLRPANPEDQARAAAVLSGQARTLVGPMAIHARAGVRHILLDMALVRGADGAAAGITMMGEDITDLIEEERRLRDAFEHEHATAERLRALDEMKDTLLRAVSHDLRTPLTSVLGLAHTLEREPRLPASTRQLLLDRMIVNAEKLQRLLADLLDVDRIQRGMIMRPDRRLVDVGAIVTDVVEAIDPQDRVIESDPPRVLALLDGPKVERIVENLVTNAIKYTTSGSKISVSVRRTDRGARLWVEQSTGSIPERVRDEVFKPFQRGHHDHIAGAGIGLAIVKCFTELHGGRVWMQNRAAGGLSFVVDLPDVSDAEDAERPRASVEDVAT